MAANDTSKVIQHLRRVALRKDGAGLTDAQLLDEYLSRREEAALAALVRRHSSMVWGVCRRILHHYHDAEDAFQATFLVFVRKAASIASPDLLANWLYGVAHQTALKARATSAKRKTRERQVNDMPEPAAMQSNLWNDLRQLLDQELSRLPDKYRSAIVLCDLEGTTRKEAARQLGVPEGTVAARVVRGRKMLAQRLARHGLALSGASLPTVLSQNTASATVPSGVVGSTIKAATLLAAGQAAATGVISVKVLALTEGVVKAMFLTRLKTGVTIMLGMGLLGISCGLYTTRAAVHSDSKQESAHTPRSQYASPGKDDAKPAKTRPSERRLILPNGPPPVQILVSLTKDGKLQAKMANLIGFGPAGGQPPAGKPPRTIDAIYDLDAVQAFDTKGEKIEKKVLAELLKDETVALASFGGQPIDPLHLRVLKEETLVFILPKGGLPFPGGSQAILPGFNQAILPGLMPLLPPLPPDVGPQDFESLK
jgi:RNA polymerase sigma factor (sigma-70 family)